MAATHWTQKLRAWAANNGTEVVDLLKGTDLKNIPNTVHRLLVRGACCSERQSDWFVTTATAVRAE
eukprot:10783132-Lingulodinium_polyedra.AAC.1